MYLSKTYMFYNPNTKHKCFFFKEKHQPILIIANHSLIPYENVITLTHNQNKKIKIVIPKTIRSKVFKKLTSKVKKKSRSKKKHIDMKVGGDGD